jgi:glycine cleavage system H protein
MDVPDDLKYTEQHEWARQEGNRIRIGITDYAQDALGDVVYVDTPVVGTQVTGGEPFGEVESTKSVSDVYAPVTGSVVEVNVLLADSPDRVNTDPYGEGWMIVIEPDDPQAYDGLWDADRYRSFTDQESGTAS